MYFPQTKKKTRNIFTVTEKHSLVGLRDHLVHDGASAGVSKPPGASLVFEQQRVGPAIDDNVPELDWLSRDLLRERKEKKKKLRVLFSRTS
jgi:hypothetical protein